MARIPGSEQTIDVLVNCKTYPAVSSKYVETVCTAGVSRTGDFVRLYPVPFRLLEEAEQYGRWDIVRVNVYRDSKDTRRESQHIEAGAAIQIVGSVKKDEERWEWMRRAVHPSAAAMDDAGASCGLVEIIPDELHWQPEKKTWSPGQVDALTQGNLFHKEEVLSNMADRVPWQFRLRFREKTTGRAYDQKVLSWDLYAGFQRFLAKYGVEQKALETVRDVVHKLILKPENAVFAIFGTHSRFKHWMVSGIYHLPRSVREGPGGLF